MRGLSHLPLLLTIGALPIIAGLPEPAQSQVPDSLQAPPVVQEKEGPPEEVEAGGISPRGAFIRSSLIPGWGHAEVGAFVRGAFYFTAEATTALMIFKTHTRMTRTQKRLDLRESVVTARLEAEGVTDPGDIESALAQDPEVEGLRALEETRGGQREDWIALGLFLMLIGGVDGYVSAHLADFPVAVVVEPTPAGGVEIGLSLPIGF
jgi:hypothetical protein